MNDQQESIEEDAKENKLPINPHYYLFRPLLEAMRELEYIEIREARLLLKERGTEAKYLGIIGFNYKKDHMPTRFHGIGRLGVGIPDYKGKLPDVLNDLRTQADTDLTRTVCIDRDNELLVFERFLDGKLTEMRYSVDPQPDQFHKVYIGSHRRRLWKKFLDDSDIRRESIGYYTKWSAD
jgi:hypothetical protein